MIKKYINRTCSTQNFHTKFIYIRSRIKGEFLVGLFLIRKTFLKKNVRCEFEDLVEPILSEGFGNVVLIAVCAT